MSRHLVAFRRIGGSPPPEREMLEIDDDGEARLWRSIGHVVGRFGGPAPHVGKLRELVKAAESVDPPDEAEDAEVPADAPIEEIEVGGRTVSFEEGVDPDGPWGALAKACRNLMTELLDQPLAAIRIAAHDAGSIRLEHVGSAAVTVELDAAEAKLELWRDRRLASHASTGPLGGGRLDAGPGWTLDIDVRGIDPGDGGRLTARVEFVADDEGVYVPMSVNAPPLDL